MNKSRVSWAVDRQFTLDRQGRSCTQPHSCTSVNFIDYCVQLFLAVTAQISPFLQALTFLTLNYALTSNISLMFGIVLLALMNYRKYV